MTTRTTVSAAILAALCGIFGAHTREKNPQRRSRPKSRPALRRHRAWQLARQLLRRGDRRAISGCRALGVGMAPARVSGPVAGEPGAHHLGLDVDTVEIADRNTAVGRRLAGQLAADELAEHHLAQRFRRGL